MLHLAQVKKNESSGGVELQLLASQWEENIWSVIDPRDIPLANENGKASVVLTENLVGILVLVELSDQDQVLSLQPAKDWVLGIVQKYLKGIISPNFLQEELERVEQWRQDLTLQSQDLTRRNLEMEARREQIQELEENLKREKKQLESMAALLKTKAEADGSSSLSADDCEGRLGEAHPQS